MAEAVGILEVFGLATAFVAADAGCKAANVHLEVFDKNKPAGIRVAESMTGVVQHYVIPNPEPGTQKMLKISALDKD